MQPVSFRRRTSADLQSWRWPLLFASGRCTSEADVGRGASLERPLLRAANWSSRPWAEVRVGWLATRKQTVT